MSEVETVPTIGISYNVELPGKKALVLQSFVPRDGDIADLNATLDKLRVSAERQFAFGMVEHLKLDLQVQEKIAADTIKNLAIADENFVRKWNSSGRKGDPKLSAPEETQQRQARSNIEACKERIVKVKKDLAEYEAKIGA